MATDRIDPRSQKEKENAAQAEGEHARREGCSASANPYNDSVLKGFWQRGYEGPVE